MKKKMIVVTLTACMLLVSACTKEEEKEPTTSVKQEVKKEEVKTKEVEKKEALTYTGLKLTPNIAIKDSFISGKIVLENTANEPIIFNELEDGQFILVKVKDQSGNLLFEETIIEKARDEMQPMEKAVWNLKGAKIKDETATHYSVSVQVLLKDSSEITYTKKEIQKAYTLEKQKPAMSFLPKINTTYVYQENEEEEGEGLKEKFLYFSGNLVQSFNDLEGKKVYFADETGLYLLHDNDFENESENILETVSLENKKVILKLPAAVGNSWTTDGVKYEVLSVTESVVTPYKAFSNVVKVKANNNTELFYHSEIGLIQVTYEGNVVQTLKDVQ